MQKGWHRRTGQPRMLSLTFPRIMGLLCAGMGIPRGPVEAADVHSSRFLCAKDAAGLCITLLLKQSNGMEVLEPSTAHWGFKQAVERKEKRLDGSQLDF